MDRNILKFSLSGIAVFVLIVLCSSSLTAINTTKAADCKKAPVTVAQKNAGVSKVDLGFESLSGKFFSSLSY